MHRRSPGYAIIRRKLFVLVAVSNRTAYGELGDDAMGKQGTRAGLAGVPAGGLPLSSTSPSKAGSRNPPPPLSPLLVQLCTVSKMTAYGEMGDDAMGKQGEMAVGCKFHPLLPVRLAHATLPRHSLPSWSNFILSLKRLLMVNWEMTP